MKRAQGLNKRLRVVGAEATTTKAAKYAAKLLKSLAKQTKRNFDPPGSNGQSSGQSREGQGSEQLVKLHNLAVGHVKLK